MSEWFIIEKMPGPSMTFKAVFGPVYSQAQADVFLQLRINWHEATGSPQVVKTMGKSRVMRMYYRQDYTALLTSVASHKREWVEFIDLIVDLGLQGAHYQALIDWGQTNG